MSRMVFVASALSDERERGCTNWRFAGRAGSCWVVSMVIEMTLATYDHAKWVKEQLDYIESMLSCGQPAVRRMNVGEKTIVQVIHPVKLNEYRDLMNTYGCSISVDTVWVRLSEVDVDGD